MLGLCEIILILWTLNEDTLKKASNAQHKKNIDKKFRYALPEMLHAFSVSVLISFTEKPSHTNMGLLIFHNVTIKTTISTCVYEQSDQGHHILHVWGSG